MMFICGVDEAGRGPIAGPVFAAAVILNPNKVIADLNDSKKLSKKKRDEIYNEIQLKALDISFSMVSSQEIDQINILQASLLAMQKAILGLKIKPQMTYIDGTFCPKIPGMKMESVIKGDQLIKEVSAASIIAKVERDRYMMKLDYQFPEYQFCRHMGYPTKLHLELIKKYGVKDFYRKTFKPVSDLIN